MVCAICGSMQAEQLKVRKINAYILWFNTSTFNENFCGMCGEAIYYRVQTSTLLGGWWGPMAFVFTLFNVPANYFAIRNHRSKIQSIEVEGSFIPRVKLSALSHNGVRVVLLLMVGIFGLAVTTSSNSSPTTINSESIVGSCWSDVGDQVMPVDCNSSDADFRVSFTTDDTDNCYDLYIRGDDTDNWDYACLVDN